MTRARDQALIQTLSSVITKATRSGPLALGFAHDAMMPSVYRGEDTLLVGAPSASALILSSLHFLDADRMSTSLFITSSPRSSWRALARELRLPGVALAEWSGIVERTRAERRAVRCLVVSPRALGEELLPAHLEYAQFFGALRRVYVPSIHHLRGDVGAEAAALFARLFRVCRFYGSHPQLISSSGVLNGAAHARVLFGREGIRTCEAKPSKAVTAYTLDAPAGGRALLEAMAAQKVGCGLFIFPALQEAQDVLRSVGGASSKVQLLRSADSEASGRVAVGLRKGVVRAVLTAGPSAVDLEDFDLVCSVGPWGTVTGLFTELERLRHGGAAVLFTDRSLGSRAVKRALFSGARSECAVARRDVVEAWVPHLCAAHKELPLRSGEDYILNDSVVGLCAEPGAPGHPAIKLLGPRGLELGEMPGWRVPLGLYEGVIITVESKRYRVVDLNQKTRVARLAPLERDAVWAELGAKFSVRPLSAVGLKVSAQSARSARSARSAPGAFYHCVIQVEERVEGYKIFCGRTAMQAQRTATASRAFSASAIALALPEAGVNVGAKSGIELGLGLIGAALCRAATFVRMLSEDALHYVVSGGRLYVYERSVSAGILDDLMSDMRRPFLEAEALLRCDCKSGCESCVPCTSAQARSAALGILAGVKNEQG